MERPNKERRKYERPKTDVVKVEPAHVICGSGGGYCGTDCRHWHICRDRAAGKQCADKEWRDN